MACIKLSPDIAKCLICGHEFSTPATAEKCHCHCEAVPWIGPFPWRPGLGDRIALFLHRWIWSKPCAGCQKRQAWLNRHPRLAIAVSVVGAAFIGWVVLRMLGL